MNPEYIHDALTLLPTDLIQQTDLLRSRSHRRSTRWLPIASAACLVLVIGSVLLLQPGIGKNVQTEAAAPEAPAMMQAAPAAPEMRMDEAPAMEEAAEAPAAEAPDTTSGHTESNFNSAAAGTKLASPVTIHIAGTSCTLSSEDSAMLNAMLTGLAYGQPESDIPAGITAEGEAIGRVTLNLKDGYAHKDDMQAALTEEQIAVIWEMILRASA